MSPMQYYRVAKDMHPLGHVFEGGGAAPLSERFSEVEEILERRRPQEKVHRGASVFFKADKDFEQVGLNYSEGYIHTVAPIDRPERRDLTWTGILQLRSFKDERFRKDLRPDLTDDEVADKWWAGEMSATPNWEWVAERVIVVSVDLKPIRLTQKGSLLGAFDA